METNQFTRVELLIGKDNLNKLKNKMDFQDKFQFNVFCNVADIIEGNGATSYFRSISEQHVPTLTNSQTA